MTRAKQGLTEFSAPASFLGQIYQIWWGLVVLLRAGRDDVDAAVSVELVDDIAIHRGGSVNQVVQTKRTSTKLTDASLPLWKTLRIWSEHTKKGSFDLKHMTLTIITTSVAPPGSAASLLRPSDRDEARALSLLESIKSENKELQRAISAFMSLTPKQRRLLVSQVRVCDASPDLQGVKAEVEREVRLLAPPRREAQFAEELGRRWMGLVEHSLLSSCVITYHDLRYSIQDILGTLQADNLPIEFADWLPASLPPLDRDPRRFVRQLRLIELKDQRIDRARLDYLRASEQRSSWARRKLIGIDELPKHEKALRDESSRRFEAACDDLPSTCGPEDKVKAGQLHYHWAEFDAINMDGLRVRPNCAEPYVVRGTFHILADRESDGLGWHPEYQSLLASSIGA